jgi:sterol carrier protein 2
VLKMGERVFVVGVGMTKFLKPGKKTNPDYHILASQAVRRALRDSGLPYAAIEAAFAGYCYGESTSGQRALYEVGLTGIPIINISNNGATGGTALHAARNFVAGAVHECVLAVGFEKMEKGSLKFNWPDRENPT